MVSEVGFGLFRRCHYGVKHRRIRACHPREQHHVRAPDKRDDAEGQGSASTWRRQCSLDSVPLSCSRADQIQLQINGRPGFHTRSLAKLPRYSGLTPLEPYLAQVDLAALHDGWSREETATHLAFALEGPALQVLIDLSPEERRDLQALTAALNCCFGQKTSTEQSREELTNRHQREEESVGAFDADIQVYARKGYPTFPATAREELSLHAFLRGLTPERLRQHVHLLSPRDLNEALREAERADEVLQAGPATGRSPLQHQLTRAAEREVDGVQPEEEEEVSRVQPAVTPRRRSKLDRCFCCGEPGHFARDCPAPSPRPRTSSPPWNDFGVRGPSPRSSSPLHNNCPTVGRCGLARGLYLDAMVAGKPCSALVETGSTICCYKKNCCQERPVLCWRTGPPPITNC